MRERPIVIWTTGLVRALLRRRAVSPLELTYYTKRGCSLCAKGRPVIDRVARARGASVNAVDIETDPALRARWGARIPVVTVGETVLAEGAIDARDLRRAILAHVERAEAR